MPAKNQTPKNKPEADKELPQLTPRQMRIIEAKVRASTEGISDAKVAQQIFPNATPASASVMMSRELKKVNEIANVRDLLADAMEEYGISPKSITKVVAQGMKATKPSGEELKKYDAEGNLLKTTHRRTADHGVRLKAAAMAAQFMGIGKGDDNAGALGGVHFHAHIENKKAEYNFNGSQPNPN